MPRNNSAALSQSETQSHRRSCTEAFSAFDWTNSGRISYSSLQALMVFKHTKSRNMHAQVAMRRCGHNPTDVEVADIINKIHDDSGTLDLEVMLEFELQF